jgi:hypothetical protein
VGDDPNFAPYPGRYIVARAKGIPPNEEPVLLDITGEADVLTQTDVIHDIVEASPVHNGGFSWDSRERVLTIRLVGAVDGSSPEVEQLKQAVLAAPADFDVQFKSVQYSRQELLDLADRIFATAHEWGPPDGGPSGGWMTDRNRVLILLNEEEQPEAWIAAIEALADDRIIYETYRLPPGVKAWEGG